MGQWGQPGQPGLSGCALSAIAVVLMRGMQKENGQGRQCGDGAEGCLKRLTFKIEVMLPQAKDCQQLPEAGRGKGWILP